MDRFKFIRISFFLEFYNNNFLSWQFCCKLPSYIDLCLSQLRAFSLITIFEIPINSKGKSKPMSRTQNLHYFLDHMRIEPKEINSIYPLLTEDQISTWREVYKVNLTENSRRLDHTQIKCHMDEFVKYEWRNLEYMFFAQCGLDSDDWKKFVLNSKQFPALKVLYLNHNNITQVKKSHLQRFKQLRYIQIRQNPLNQESKQALRKLRQRSKYIAYFDE